jgi:hypothetical protein
MAVLEPTNLLLLACAVLYGLLGEPADAAVLLLFVAAITLLDAVQQHRSNRALAPLHGADLAGLLGATGLALLLALLAGRNSRAKP